MVSFLPSRNDPHNSGFTLVEVVIAMFVVSIIVLISSGFFLMFSRNYEFSMEQGRSISEAQMSFKLLVAELREVITSEDGAYALITANDQELEFYADVDNDGRIERVRYYLSGDTLFRGLVEPDSNPPLYDGPETTREIASFITNGSEPIFYYYNGNWPGDSVNNPLSLGNRLLDTRLIEARVRVNTAPQEQQDFELSTQVTLRNLKTNY